MKALGGAFEILSSLGKGTTATLSLPVSESAASPEFEALSWGWAQENRHCETGMRNS